MSGLHLEEEFIFRGGRFDSASFGEEGDLRPRELVRQILAVKIRAPGVEVLRDDL
jgi:hypothetical protein